MKNLLLKLLFYVSILCLFVSIVLGSLNIYLENFKAFKLCALFAGIFSCIISLYTMFYLFKEIVEDIKCYKR